MKTAIALYKLGRPFNALSGALAVLVGGYVAGTGRWSAVLLAACVVFLVTASSNAWNDYLDIEIDRINQPQRVLPAGDLPPWAALAFSLALAALSTGLAAFVNLPTLAIVAASNLVLYLYSWRLKSTVLLGNATVAAISAASVVLGGVAAGNVGPSLTLAVVAATIMMAREILKTIVDYEGDLRRQVRTVATVWGRRAAHSLFVLLALAGCVLLMLPYMLSQFEPIYAVITVVGIYPVVFYILISARHNAPPHQLHRLSQLLKYDFLVWFVAIVLGARFT